MKNLIIVLSLIIATSVSAQTYDTAITILQASEMTTKSAGSLAGNGWLITSGYVQQSVSFPTTRTYRFDFTGHGTNKTVTIAIDGTTKSTFTVNSGSVNSLWSSSFSVASGAHTVKISTSGTTNLYMALLYIFSSNSVVAIKYPAIVNTTLPAFASAYINSNQIGTGKLRGYNTSNTVRSSGETLDPNDFAIAAARGANIIRTRAEVVSNGTSYAFVAHTFDTLDAFISRANTNNIYLDITMSDQNTAELFFGNATLKSSYIARYKELVQRYKTSKVVACFALVNEPGLVGTLGEWCMFAQQIASAIKRIDTNHVIVMPHCTGVQDIWKLTEPLPYSKVVYEYHSYLPFEFTHQGINASDNVRTEYPNTTSSPYYNAAYLGVYGKPDLSATLADIRSYSAKYNVPILIGESGCVHYSPNYSSCRYVQDASDLFEAEGWSWCYESYRRYEPWDGEISPKAWYNHSTGFVNAFPTLTVPIGTMSDYRSDTTCVTQTLISFFALNSTAPSINIYHKDLDSDKYGNPSDTLMRTTRPSGYVRASGDCDDSNATVYPGAVELYDSLDNNCNGQIDEGKQTLYYDADADGYGNLADSIISIAIPPGYTNRGDDCNDSNAAIHPGATEICDEKDNNCNGIIDENCSGTTVKFSNTSYYAKIKTGQVKLTVIMSKPMSTNIIISFSTADGTATAGKEYYAKSASLIISPGIISGDITIDLVRKYPLNTTKYFTVKLNTAPGTIINSPSVATVYVSN